MSRTASPATGRNYGVVMVTQQLRAPRSTFYARRQRAVGSPAHPAKRGPKAALTDNELTEKIQAVLKASPFVGEGHRKVWARLRHMGIRVGRPRVNRLMRQANLLAPGCRPASEPKLHDGTITTERPDLMWGTDATATWTLEDGYVTVFAAVDHCNSECIGLYATKPATRFEALEPIRQGVREHFGSYQASVASGLKLRHDHGSVYMSEHFQQELRFLGIHSSPAFIREPEGNGCIERFFRTLKEQLLWLRTYRNIDELQAALTEWRSLYNHNWLVARHGFRSPLQIRADLLVLETAA